LISDFAYCDTLPSRGLFVMFVCHVRALCSNGTICRHDFFGIRPHHFPPRWCWNLSYIGQPLPPQIWAQSDPPPNVDSSVGDIRTANCGRMVRESTMVTTHNGVPKGI